MRYGMSRIRLRLRIRDSEGRVFKDEIIRNCSKHCHFKFLTFSESSQMLKLLFTRHILFSNSFLDHITRKRQLPTRLTIFINISNFKKRSFKNSKNQALIPTVLIHIKISFQISKQEFWFQQQKDIIISICQEKLFQCSKLAMKQRDF